MTIGRFAPAPPLSLAESRRPDVRSKATNGGRRSAGLAAANEYAETGVFQDCGCEQSEIHFVDGEVTADEAVAAVKDGRSEKRTIVHRRMSAAEIEVARLDALAERELAPLGAEPFA